MKSISKYINEWKLNDQSINNIDIDNINELIAKIHSCSKQISVDHENIKDWFGIKIYQHNFDLNEIWNILKSKAKRINKINNTTICEYFKNLKDKDILLIYWNQGNGYCESVEIFFKVNIGDMKYCCIAFYDDAPSTFCINIELIDDEKGTNLRGNLKHIYKFTSSSCAKDIIDCINRYVKKTDEIKQIKSFI